MHSALISSLRLNRPAPESKNRTSKENTWNLWLVFCAEHGQDPYLSQYKRDKLDFFVVFGLRYRRGDIAKDSRGNPITDGPGVRAQAVKVALQAVGERFAELDGVDPRLLLAGQHLVPHLAGLYTFFDNEDPPASRIWPVTLTILRSLRRRADLDPDPVKASAIVDLCILAFSSSVDLASTLSHLKRTKAEVPPSVCPTSISSHTQIHGRSYLSDRIDSIDHPAKPVLQAYRDRGVPVHVTGEAWSSTSKPASIAGHIRPPSSTRNTSKTRRPITARKAIGLYCPMT